MRVRLSPRALIEATAAVDWYDEISPRLGDRFQIELDNVLDRLATFPESAPVLVESFRSVPVGRFPYSVVYALMPDEIVVHSVWQSEQDPDLLFESLTR